MVLELTKGGAAVKLGCGKIHVENPQYDAQTHRLTGSNYQVTRIGENIIEKLEPLLNIGVNEFTTNYTNISVQITKRQLSSSYTGTITNIAPGGGTSVVTFTNNGFSYTIIVKTGTGIYDMATMGAFTAPTGTMGMVPNANGKGVVNTGGKPCFMTASTFMNNTFMNFITVGDFYWSDIRLCYNGQGASQRTATGFVGSFSAVKSNKVFTDASPYLINASGYYTLINNTNGIKYQYPEAPVGDTWNARWGNWSFYTQNASTLQLYSTTDTPEPDEPDEPSDDGG